MARRSVAAACVAVIAWFSVPLTAGQAADVLIVHTTATRTTETIRIDGRLDEAAWQSTIPLSRFVQREPVEGGEPSEETEIRVLLTGTALYIGAVCHDRSPREIIATQLSRDADLEVDDRLTIVLDPFFDHRNGFFFQVNAAGARADGQVSNNAESLSRDWDGIWNAAARITTDGWVAEIEIPFKTLRFKPGQPVWGFNVERQIKRRQEIDRWTAARQNVWISNLAEVGQLDGLDGVGQGLGLDVRPYGSAGRSSGAGDAAAGVDLFKSLTPSVNAAVTVNTDFAETEADLRQVNLTRFPLFFPEKRSFFLEGAGVFDVAGLINTTDLRPFFSRRIGLLDDVAVPVRLGVKLTGRQSDYNIGVLEVETGAVGDAALPGGSIDRQNLLVARVSRNLFQQSWVGGILTHGDPSGSGTNTLIGGDARFATSTFHGNKNLSLDLFLLGTDDGATGARDGAGGFRIDYPNDRWDVALNWRQIGERFQPALGFVPRTGIRKTDVSLAFQPRPERWGVRQFFFEVNPVVVTNVQNRLESWSVFTAPVNLRTESGEHLEWDYVPTFEHLDLPFEISPGVVIPSGSYRWTRYRTEVNTATKRWWVIDAAVWWGGFYEGTLGQVEFGATLKPSRHVALSVQGERDVAMLPEGAFQTDLLTVKADYNVTPNLSWANLAQYDNESRVLGLQSRFRWILQPGNDLFLTINRGWHRTLDEGRFEPVFDRASAKLQYTTRF
ncbi:MAG: hypothetical protein JWL71_4003 [Acidobacteria bacterium]|nr:hypothetical protein [Acidobacteriota bacterium]